MQRLEGDDLIIHSPVKVSPLFFLENNMDHADLAHNEERVPALETEMGGGTPGHVIE
jgi:hypothetical protein